MKHKKIIKIISNIFFGVGVALGAYAFYIMISSSANLPAGVCPVDNSRPFMIIAVIFLVISLALSFLTNKKRPDDTK